VGNQAIQPKAPIRRFDVFAEYTRLEKLQEGLPEDQAKGYAVWLAKVVAARKYGRMKVDTTRRVGVHEEHPLAERTGFRALGGVVQSDEVFDKDIVTRMGKHFYEKVFAPAIEEAFRKGSSYRDIRDSIRKAWRP